MPKHKYIVVDVETTSKDWYTAKLHGIGVGYSEDDIQYYPAWDVPDNIRQDLANPKIAKIGHNFHGYDGKVLRKAGFEVKGPIDDTMITENLIDPDQPLGLKYLAEKYFGPESIEKKKRLDKYISDVKAGHIGGLCALDLLDENHPHLEIIAEYCKEDVLNTLRIFFRGIEKLKEMDKTLKSSKFGFKKSPLDCYIEECRPLESVLFEMEYRGIRVNIEEIDRIKSAAVVEMDRISDRLNKILINRIHSAELEIYEAKCAKAPSERARAKLGLGVGPCRFSWTNNNHVGLLLYKYCGLDERSIFTTEKGKFRTDKAAIGSLQAILPKEHRLQEVLALFLEYKRHMKIVSTYTGTNKKGIMSKVREVSPGHYRIFPSYRQTTGTGRLAASNPNMQNLKQDSEVKKFFIPDNSGEVFDDADYSQIELRTGAHLSQDPTLCSAYVAGDDVHLLTASRLFGREITKKDYSERQAGKRTNFLTIFDGKWPRLQASLKAGTGKDFSERQCKEFIRAWFDLYSGVRDYLDSQLEVFRQYKFCISETGRIRRLPDIIYGQYVEWVPNGDGSRDPKFTGPQHLLTELIKEIRHKQPKYAKREIPEAVIGLTAYRKYSHAVKMGYNMPIQGLAASMTKRAMIQLHKAGRTIVNQVHDSLVVSRKRGDSIAKQQVIDLMEKTYSLSIPVLVDVKTISTFHPEDIVKE